jgi:hypothetical protein
MSALCNPVSISAGSAHHSSSPLPLPAPAMQHFSILCNTRGNGHSLPSILRQHHPRNTRAQNKPTKSATNPTQNQSGAIKNPDSRQNPHIFFDETNPNSRAPSRNRRNTRQTTAPCVRILRVSAPRRLHFGQRRSRAELRHETSCPSKGWRTGMIRPTRGQECPLSYLIPASAGLSGNLRVWPAVSPSNRPR